MQREKVVSAQDALREARKAQSACMFSNTWLFSVSGLVAAIPASIYWKTYAPLVVVSVVGSGADYMRGMSKCEQFVVTVKTLEANIRAAEKEAAEPTADDP
jgi:hypothetical protein